MEKNVDQSQHTCRSRKCTLDLRNFVRDSRKHQKGLSEDLPLLEQTTQLTHMPFVLEATLAIPLTKLSRRINLLNESQLYYKTMNCEKNSAFCSVTMYHPTVASPKENLYVYQQRASNPAITERNIGKPNSYLLRSCPKQHSLVSYHSLPSLYVMSGLSALWVQQCRLVLLTMRKEFNRSLQQTFVGQERVTNAYERLRGRLQAPT